MDKIRVGQSCKCTFCDRMFGDLLPADAMSGAIGCVWTAMFTVDHASTNSSLGSQMFMTRESLLGPDPSGTRSVLAWTVCGAWSAQCRCLLRTVLKQSSDIVASPGTMLAPAFSTDRELQQQHILTPALAKDTLAQHHAHHCSVCGAARHTHTG